MYERSINKKNLYLLKLINFSIHLRLEKKTYIIETPSFTLIVIERNFI